VIDFATNIGSGIAGGLGLVLFYGFSFWRIFKANPGNRVIECGSIALMVFVAMLALFKIPNFPVWVLASLGSLLFLLCLLTMLFVVQRGYRALHDRKSPVAPRPKRPISDFLKLLGTAVLIVAAVTLIAIGSAKYDISRSGTTRLLSAFISLFVAGFVLQGTRKNWNYISQLPDSVGNRKIKRRQKMIVIVALLFLVGAAWNFWLFASLK